MTTKQWLAITVVVILNLIVLGALLGPPPVEEVSTPVPTRTSYPTFTPLPRATSTAILMPTLAPSDRSE